jgi:hypothetical protein
MITIKKLENLKSGDQVLLDTPIWTDETYVLCDKYKSPKYPVISNNGEQQRALGMGKFISAKEEKQDPNSTETVYMFKSMTGGSLTIKESSAKDTIKAFNLRKIDSNNPKWNPELSSFGEDIGDMLSSLEKIFG